MLALGAGAGAAAALHLTAVLPLLGLGRGEPQRIAVLAEHLRSDLRGRSPAVFVLGNSISVEGYDAGIMEDAAPEGVSVFNLAINGCDPSELIVLLPAVLETRPHAVVLTLRPADLGVSTGIPPDKAYAYAFGGIPALHASPLQQSDLIGTSERSVQALQASSLRASLHFRSVLLTTLNQSARTALRSELRAADPGDIVAPFHMLGSISGPTLDRHLDVVAAQYAQRIDRGFSGRDQITRIAREIHEAGAIPMLVVAPTHPRIRDREADAASRLRDLLNELAETYDGIVIDASHLLDADDFADALHPNERGRNRLSIRVGSNLPPPFTRSEP